MSSSRPWARSSTASSAGDLSAQSDAHRSRSARDRRARRLDRGLISLIGLAYGLVALVVLSRPPSGDEPRYLLMAHSIVYDHDINLANNVRNRDYQAFGVEQLGFEMMRPFGHPDTAYAVHTVGLPVAIAPGYAIAGRAGATATLVAIATLGVAGALRLARRVVPHGPAAPTAVGLVAGSMPLLFYPSQVFPETVAAAALIWALVLIVGPARARDGNPALALAVGAGGLLAALPWLHAKFLAPAAVLYLIAAIRWWPSPLGWRRLGALGLPMVLSLVVMSQLYRRWYGNPWPNGPLPASSLALENLPAGLVGLAIDREYGLLVWSPIYALALVGLALALVRRAPLAVEVGLVAASLWLLAALNGDWWGGASIAPRYLVPILPLLAAPLAYALDRWRGWPARTAAAALAGLSLLHAGWALAVAGPDLARAEGTGENPLLAWYDLSLARVPPRRWPELNAIVPTFLRGRVAWDDAPDLQGEVGGLVEDAAARSGHARRARPGLDRAGDLVWHVTWRLRGPMLVRLRVRGEPTSAVGPAVLVERTSGGAPAAIVELWRHGPGGPALVEAHDLPDPPGDGRFADVTVRLTSPTGADEVELRLRWLGERDLALDYVEVWRD